MNTAVIKPETTQADYEFAVAQGKSMLDRIVAQLSRVMFSYRIPQKNHDSQVGFIEQNLTDPNLGPEISRALR